MTKCSVCSLIRGIISLSDPGGKTPDPLYFQVSSLQTTRLPTSLLSSSSSSALHICTLPSHLSILSTPACASVVSLNTEESLSFQLCYIMLICQHSYVVSMCCAFFFLFFLLLSLLFFSCLVLGWWANLPVQSCHVYLHLYNATACTRAPEHAMEVIVICVWKSVMLWRWKWFLGEKPDSCTRGPLVQGGGSVT